MRVSSGFLSVYLSQALLVMLMLTLTRRGALSRSTGAVRTLRAGFGESPSPPPHTQSGHSHARTHSHSHRTPSSGLDIRIGAYRPGAANARRIALFAMKLELRDLREAIGKVAVMAQKSRSRERLFGGWEGESDGEGQEADEGEGQGKDSRKKLRKEEDGGIDPIDQLV